MKQRVDEAQVEKESLEDQQRKDAKLRKEHSRKK
jgi:hypothetical protein